MFEVNVRTMDSLAVVVRWSILMLIGVSWHVNSQTVQQTTEVDNSYNFYYEQPCCSGTVTKSKYHMRHRRGKCFIFKTYKHQCKMFSI